MITFPGQRSIGIVGAGLGGLSAAVHLARQGWKVTVYEANEQPGGRANRIRAHGFTFDTGPTLLNYPWVFEQLFASAGRKLSDYLELLPVDPSVHFRWPDGETFTLSSRLPTLLAECERLEPGCGPGLMAFLADAERKYNFSFGKLVTHNATNPLAWFGRLRPSEMAATSIWRSLYGQLNRFFRNPRICEALGSYGMYLGGSPWKLPGLFSILAYGELAYGLWLPRGGMYALVEAVARLAGEMGVDLRTRTPVRNIRLENGRVAGLDLKDGAFQAHEIVVSNLDAPASRERLLPPPFNRRANNLLRKPHVMTPGVVTFYWGLRGKPAGLDHHTIFLPVDARRAFDDLFRRRIIPDDLPFYTSIASATDPGLAPPGDSAVFAQVPAPVGLEPVDWGAAAADLRTRIIDRLRRHGVDWREDAVAFEQVWTPASWRQRFGLHQGSAFGAAHTLFQLGPMRDRNFEPGLRGLYYVGAGVPPGTGLPMVTLGGRMVAERIEQDFVASR